MKAQLIFESRRVFKTTAGQTVVIQMDLFELASAIPKDSPAEQYRLSWIAYDQANPDKRVLFDCHPPKGPHFHLDGDKIGQLFTWHSVEGAIQLFRKKVKQHFGELLETADEEDQDK